MATKKKKPDWRQIFISRLKTLRNALQLDQRGMSGHLRIDAATYYKYETGERFPSRTMLLRMSQRFNVSLDWLLLGEGEMFRLTQEEKERRLNEETKPSPEVLEQIEDLKAQLETAKAETVPGIKEDMKELVTAMLETPLLYHEIMIQYQRYKAEKEKDSA